MVTRVEKSKPARRVVVALLAVILAIPVTAALVDPAVANQDQITLYSHEGVQAKNQYFEPHFAQPPSYVSPVNYRDGGVFLRLDVIDKPSLKEMWGQLCFWRHGSKNYQYETCSFPKDLAFTHEGRYYVAFGSLSSLWQKNGSFDWSKPVSVSRFMLKDPVSNKLFLTSSCGGACYPYSDIDQHVPVRMRVDVVLVAKGKSLTPPVSWRGDCPKSWSSLCQGTVSVAPPASPTTTTAPGVAPAPSPSPSPSPPPIMDPAMGYWVLESDGDVTAFGAAPALASVRADLSGTKAVAMAGRPQGDGYWVLGRDGRILARGKAPRLGSIKAAVLDRPGERFVAMTATADGRGLHVFSSHGRVIPLGTAPALSNQLLGLNLAGAVVGAAATPTGRGAYLVGADGGVFSLGDAVFRNSVPGVLRGARLAHPAVGIVPDPDGAGYWVVARDGGVFTFDAPFRGALPSLVPYHLLAGPVTAMVPYGTGYLLIASDGGVFPFSNLPFLGSASGQVDAPVVSVAAPARFS